MTNNSLPAGFAAAEGQGSQKQKETARFPIYDSFTIFLHWATVLLVVILYALAQIWGLLEKGTPPRHALQSLHVSLGIVLTVVIVARLLWRGGPGRKLPEAIPGFLGFAAKAVHYLLYAMLVAQTVLGWLFRWAQGEILGFFGLFTIPSPFVFTVAQRQTFGSLHDLLGTLIIIVAAGHAGAALFHHYVCHDGVLVRMLPGLQKRLTRS
ncbi:cytochrome b [Beijerinckia indica]|uniref:Cytochrome B561 n=1 Tax=Beijerinckia indica subsp. indica (strain ATCC 9039 / DSM 1715 / NCIMB 8712) TaxID=395963 RepID=B2IJS4_BEII9|nr:cytochrome b [Beijerinckia indica]ACB94946.1 cytochrome B561 [Beijerinckia indica subsp. indica ATCC 9039]